MAESEKTIEPVKETLPPMIEDSHWHIDKKVPVALLLGLGVQALGAFWWAASTSARVDQLERQVAAAAPQAERLIRVEEKLGGVQASLAEIKAALTAAAAATQPRR